MGGIRCSESHTFPVCGLATDALTGSRALYVSSTATEIAWLDLGPSVVVTSGGPVFPDVPADTGDRFMFTPSVRYGNGGLVVNDTINAVGEVDMRTRSDAPAAVAIRNIRSIPGARKSSFRLSISNTAVSTKVRVSLLLP